MDRDSRICIIGDNDAIENSLFSHFKAHEFAHVDSSSRMGLNPTIQSSVYDLFLKKKYDYVFLGSTRSGGIEANQKNPAEFIYHNLESQNNVIYAAHKFGVKKLLYYGGSCVYPKNCPQPIKPEYLLTGELEKTNEPYALAKMAGIKMCQAYKKQYGFNAIVMIPATVYGPGSDTDVQTAHVIAALIGKFAQAKAENHSQVSVWGTGNPRREFIYVDDFINASLLLMERYDGDDIINVGCAKDISIKELALKISEICEYKGEIVFDTSKPDGTNQKLLDNSQILDLGWTPRTSLDEGILKTYQWYQEKQLTRSTVHS